MSNTAKRVTSPGGLRFRALRIRLTMITLCFALIPLAALGYFIQSRFSSAYTDTFTSSLELVTKNKRDTIEMFLHERIGQLRNLAYSYAFEEISDQSVLNRLFGVVRATSGSFIDFGIIDSSGQHAAYVGPYPLNNVNYADEQWFHKVMLKGVYVSDVFMGFRHFPHFIIAIRRQEGEQSWVLRATIDSEVFTSLVQNVQVGLRGDAFLVNSENILQTPSRFGGKVLTEMRPAISSPVQGVAVTSWRDDEENMIAAVVRMPSTGWRLVVAASPLEELSPLSRTRSITFALLIAGMLMILVGSFLTNGFVVRKLMHSEKERALMDAAVMQSCKMASLGKLAAGVAHEINNPLTIIRESAGWIRDVIMDGELGRSPVVEQLTEAVDDIDRHVERARTVTHRMLGFARRMEPVQEHVDLNVLVCQTAGFLESEARHRDVDILFDLQNELPDITTDANQIQQVILNLMENGLDAVGRDGSLTVRTRMEGDRVALSVIDTGPGIPEENLQKVFDPFFTTKPVGKGTGLGLSIIYSTMQRLGGDVVVHSTLGQGAEFTITLPVVPKNGA